MLDIAVILVVGGVCLAAIFGVAVWDELFKWGPR